MSAEIEALLKPAAAEFPESEEFLQLLLATGDVGTWDWSPTTVEQPKKYSARFFEMLGQPSDSLPMQEDFLRCLHPDDLPGLQVRLQKPLSATFSLHSGPGTEILIELKSET